jgi:hypothetical protein
MAHNTLSVTKTTTLIIIRTAIKITSKIRINGIITKANAPVALTSVAAVAITYATQAMAAATSLVVTDTSTVAAVALEAKMGVETMIQGLATQT